MRITAWILVFALCLTIGFADTGRENAAPIALAAEESAENEVWEYKAIGAGKVAITKYTGEDTRLQIPETIETDSGSCIVAEIGRGAFKNCSTLRDITFPEGLERIEYSAFAGCGITSIEIPASVTFVAGDAFAGCENLEKITVAEGNTMYTSGDNCNAIINVTSVMVGCKNTVIPDDATGIFSEAFAGCTGLENIRIPETVTFIGMNAFKGCTGLKSVEFAKGSQLSEIYSFAFSDCTELESISLPSEITRVEMGTFSGCSSLKRVELPEGVTVFKSYAFRDCSSLTELNFPESLTNIEERVFARCESLAAVRIPSGMTEIKESTFSGCKSLTEITIPDSITKIGDSAFGGCESLTKIELPEGLTELGTWVFSECDSLTRVDLPDSLTSIPKMTFYSCDKLTDVGFPSALTEIEDNAFSHCEGLTKLEIPEGVTKLGDSIFYQSPNFKEIKLPDTLESIGDEIFVGTSIESLVIPKNVSSIGDGLFNGQDDVPSDCFTKICHIVVDEENETFDSREDCNAIIETKTGELLYGSNAATKIPEGVKTVVKYAFAGCKDLESVEFSSTVSSIHGHIFARCAGLSKITVSADNPVYDSKDNCNAVLSGSRLIVGCKTTKIPDDVSELEKAAFSGCIGLTEIELPRGLKTIPDMAFLSCINLKSVKIPYGVRSIETYAFNYCENLESVYIPSTVEIFDGFGGRMGNVFLSCSKLTIYTTEGAKAVEFAEKYGIPYSFDAMPEEEKPEETKSPEETNSPKESSAPVQSLQPQETVKPVAEEPSAKPAIRKPARAGIKTLKNKSGKKVTVTLSKNISGAAGYEVAYATKSSMKNQKKKSFSGTSVTIKGLKKKKTYYFRVRAYAKAGGKTIYGDWSKKMSIKVKK